MPHFYTGTTTIEARRHDETELGALINWVNCNGGYAHFDRDLYLIVDGVPSTPGDWIVRNACVFSAVGGVEFAEADYARVD